MLARSVMTCLCTASVTVTAIIAQSGSHRVRSERPAIAALVDEGLMRSTTFATLVTSIDQSDGLVYVEEGMCRHSVHACLAMSIVTSGSNRLLRIRIDPRRPRRRLIASIGHELHHVVEVLSHRGIRDNAALFHFFQQRAPTARDAFETTAAVQAGLDIYAELASDE
jgi:hypothetical protein